MSSDRRPDALRASLYALLGVWLVCAYALTAVVLPAVADPLKWVMLLAGFIGIISYRPLRRCGGMYLLLFAVVIVLLSWGLSHLTHPQWAERSPKLHRLTDWFTFLAVAWLLSAHRNGVWWAWLAGLVGLLLAPWLLGAGWHEWHAGWQGARIDFGIHNAQHTSLYFAVAALALMAFLPRLAMSERGRWWRLGTAFPALLVCLLAVMMSQTRGVWLGLFIAFAVLFGVKSIALVSRKGRHGRRLLLAFSAVFVVLIGTVFVVHGDRISARLIEERAVLTQAAEHGVSDALAESSIGARLVVWRYGWDWFVERPWLGWGGNGRRLIFDQETLPDGLPEGIGHLHSTYMDAAVNFGIAGVLLWLAIILWQARQLWGGWRGHDLSFDMLAFYLSFVVFWLTVNAFESFMFFTSGSIIFALIMGGALAPVWYNRRHSMPVDDSETGR